MSELAMPDGWNSDSLETFLSFALGGDWGKPADYDDPEFETVYCIRGTEISHWAKTNGSTAVERKIKATSLEKRKLQEGDILVEISGGGPDQPVGRTVVIEKKVLNKFKTDNIICTNFLRMFRPTKFINPKFLNFYLQMFYSSGYINEYQSGSNNLRNLKFKEFLTIDVPFAPIDEQNAIVSELEKYFETVSQIQARLDAIPKLIEKFRQSVLNDAVSGRLTEDWRLNKDCSALNDYKKMLDNESITDKTIKEKIKLRKEASIENINDDKGWINLPFFELVLLNRGFDLSTSNRVIGDIPIMSSSGLIDYHNEKRVEGPCIVVGRSGSVGKVFYTELACWPLNTTLYVKSFGFSNPRYTYWALKNMRLERFASSTAVPSLNRNVFMFEEVSIPPIEEQIEIVKRIEEFYSYADQIEKSVATAKARVDNLSQSILHQAFTGSLTKEWREQNPDLISGENSAEALLAKIKAEKQGSGKKKSGKG